MRNDLRGLLNERVLGQPEAVDEVARLVERWEMGLDRGGRPAGVVLLTGPTGVGKTYLVEMLAEVLHGNRGMMIRVDCGEFQMEHEVAKLIGAPAGYIGHRETQPWITNAKLGTVRSEECGLAVVLFDEIDKGAESLKRLLLGVLDRGELKLGDGQATIFRNCLVVMTSNYGAKEIMKVVRGGMGFGEGGDVSKKGRELAKGMVSPEFMNRVDVVVGMRVLKGEEVEEILRREKVGMERMADRWGWKVEIEEGVWEVLRGKAMRWVEYGAREARRVWEKEVGDRVVRVLVGKDAATRGLGGEVLVRVGEDGEIMVEERKERMYGVA